jgi:hypothetical protein
VTIYHFRASSLFLKPGFDRLPGKPPLSTHFEAVKTAIMQHAVDGYAIDLK